MSSQKRWIKGAVAGIGALVLVTSTMFPAEAMNRGSQNGNETNGCNVVWRAESVLDIDLQENDPKYPNLVHDENDGPAGQNYQYTGFIREVSPKFDKQPKDPGYMEIGHHYQNGDDTTPVRVAAANTKQHWRVNFGTDKALSDAKIIFTLPAEVRGKPVTVDVVGGAANVNTWPHFPYNTFNDQRIALDPSAVVDNSDGTWTINMGDLVAKSSRVVDFYVEVGTTLNLTDQFVASAVLTARGTDAACQQPPKPADKVVEGEWTDGTISCDAPKVTQTRTITTTPYVWDDQQSQWVLGQPSERTENREREKTEQEREQCKPQDLVEYTEWEDGEKTCEKATVTQTRTKTVTSYSWNEANEDWVANAPVMTQESRERDKTPEELEECKPADKVVEGEWTDGAISCDAVTVTQSRTITTTPYVWNTQTKMWDLGQAVERTETRERDKTQEERENCKPAERTEYTEWKDGEVTCASPIVTQTRTKSVTSFTWDETTKQWKPGTPVVTEETQEREKTQAEHDSCKPADKVELSEWKDGKVSCEAPKVTQTRTKSVTTHVFDAASKTWKPGTPVVTEETKEREKTKAEHDACKPADKVELTEWKDGKVSCDAPKVTQTRTKSVTTHVFDDASKTWKPGTPVVTTETREREKTAAEKASCPEAAKPSGKKLAQTGSTVAPLALVAASLTLGGMAFVATKRRRA